MSSRKNKEIHKRCRCQPSCGKILVKRSRQHHYRKIRDKSLILPSETVSEASDKDSIFSGDEHDFSASNDVEMTEQIVAKAVSERAMSIDSSNYASSNITGSPLASHQGDYADNHTDFKFDSDDMDEDQSEQNSADGAEELLDFEDVEYNEEEEMEGFLTIEELQQRLEDEVGGELERQLYEARA